MQRKLTNIAFLVFLLALAAINLLIFWVILASWVVLSFAAVGVAYALNWAKIFRKNRDGSIPPSVRLLFMPFLFGSNVYNIIKRSRDPVPPAQKIIEHLYVGSRLRANDIEHLKGDKIRAVLDVTAEFDGLGQLADDKYDINYLNIPVLDHAVPKEAQLLHACRWIHEHRRQGHAVLVHCALGRGRSVLFAAAYLICIGEAENLEQALAHIKGIRLTANLNKRQTRKVEKWLKQDLGKIILRNKACIIANPAAGAGKWQELRQPIEESLSRYFTLEVLETTPDLSAAQLTEEALKRNPDIIIACGGDGTLNEVVNVLAGTTTPLGILPMGTANSVAQSFLGWEARFNPVDIACQTIVDGQIKRVDTAVCNGERMLLAVGLGIEDHMVRHASHEEKERLGAVAYLQGFFDGISSGESLKLNVSFDQAEPVEINARSFVIANAAPPTSILSQGHGSPIPDDGELDVTIITEGESLGDDLRAVGALAISAVANTEVESNVQFKLTRDVVIESAEPLFYIIDGETRQADSIHITIEKHSLLLFAPQDQPVQPSDNHTIEGLILEN